jgi:alpha-1,2-mannosyltransferase
LTAAVAIFVIWRMPTTFADRGAALCLAALLATPYCLDYDLMALAPAIALLGAQGLERGFRPCEKSLLVLLWLVPIVTRETAEILLLPLGTIAMLLAAAFLARRALREGPLPVSARSALILARPFGAG